MSRAMRFGIVGMAAAAYAVSFFLPTYRGIRFGNPPTPYTGADAFAGAFLAIGEWAVLAPDYWVFVAAWLANPLFWAGLVLGVLGRWRGAAIFSGVALVFALPVMVRLGNHLAPYPGWYVWSGSAALLLAGSIVGWRAVPQGGSR